jgi:ABC-type branched-subunit amino acid transport system substrate-binding protein
MSYYSHLKRDGVFAVNYCIKPNCPNFDDSANQSTCPNCGPEILLQGRYRVIQRLGNGSFGQIFEVEDVRGDTSEEGGTRKVLKVLRTDYPPAVRLFQREAKVLSQLEHPGVPRVEPDGYFKSWLQDSTEPLHCLVMEKINGINLQECLKNRNNQPIDQEQAIAHLKQLALILEQIHQQRYLHRDIKPSNIMLRPNGQLVLIDFGAVREATQTYLQRLQNSQQGSGTVIISPGYTPPEQAIGQAVLPQSDFYALGRTFVHLLTGKHPIDTHNDSQTNPLNWRNSAPHVSREFADLIDWLMAYNSENRPENARLILQRLQEIETPINRSSPSNSDGNVSTEVPTMLPNSGNSRIPLWLAFSTILLLVLAGSYFYWKHWQQPKACDSSIGDSLSCGEEVLVPDSGGDFKQKGVQEIAAGKYDEAVRLLIKARQENPRDPETLIYLNNARIASQKANSYTLAVVAPISKSSDTALEILRGVAQAQEEINQGKKIKGIALRIVIADDANDGTQAKKIAEKLVSKRDILGVIGHYASEVTLEALPVYQKHKLVLISPSSTSAELSKWGMIPSHFFFRTVPTTQISAQYLASYLNAQTNQKTAAVFNVPKSSFSRSISDQFRISFRASGGKVLENKFDLSNPAFNAAAALDQAGTQGATALAVFPDGGTTAFGIPNTLRLVSANQGRNWIVGSNTLYSPDTLQVLGKDALNRFIVVVSWHYLDSDRNPVFPQAARTLWRGNVSWRTATAYDATRALIAALEKQPSPSRENLQQVLADKDFQAQGATGTISFLGSDRKESFSTLVKVVRSNCSPDSYTFVPLNYKDSGPDCRK